MASGFPNPYGQGSPYPGGQQPMYRSQQPRQRTPGVRTPRPRFQGGPYPPQHDASPRWPQRGPSPGGGEHFRGTPPHFPGEWTPRRGSPGGFRGSYGGRGADSPNYRGSPNFRGRGGGSPNYRGRGAHRSGPPDSNPGGSDDISQYFHPSMLEDPWAGLTPLPLPESNFKT